MRESIYSDILDVISEIVPMTWNRLVFRAEDSDTMWSYVFYIRRNASYVQCYEVPELKEDDLDEAFERIRELITDAREAQDSWNVMTICVTPNGDPAVTFDCLDENVDRYEYTNEWKRIFLSPESD